MIKNSKKKDEAREQQQKCVCEKDSMSISFNACALCMSHTWQ